jgi:exopolyphosphatase/guanosine-5'-triphosphate,3'-diphosphate pyrophosphatase
MELARRCQFREPHATHVARLALSIFHQTRRLHGLHRGDAELLEYAALLHDVGFHVAPHRHHRHTEYLIQSHDMAGFSRDEVNVISLVARYHRKAEPSKSHDSFMALSKADRKRVRHLAAILRVADGLDRTDARLVRAVRCVITDKIIEMRLDADGDPELELWAARRKGDMLEELADRKLRLTVDAVHDRDGVHEDATDARGRLQVVR